MDNWIKDAFEHAGDESTELMEAEDFVTDFMIRDSEHLVDGWLQLVPPKMSRVLATALQDKALRDAIYELCGCFCMTGYMYGKHNGEGGW